jgi:hypothetical protein
MRTCTPTGVLIIAVSKDALGAGRERLQKKKNEMIRHGLIHDSPGYVCPFCPDREHKYPRPDNLQRYIWTPERSIPEKLFTSKACQGASC